MSIPKVYDIDIDEHVDKLPAKVNCPDCGQPTSDSVQVEALELEYAFVWWPCDRCEQYVELELYVYDGAIQAGTFCSTDYDEDGVTRSYAHNSAIWRPNEDGTLPLEAMISADYASSLLAVSAIKEAGLDLGLQTRQRDASMSQDAIQVIDYGDGASGI